MDVHRYLFSILIVSLILAFLISLFIIIFIDFSFIILVIGIFLLIQSSVYAYLVLSADAKARFVESILPDVLQLMSSNLRAGHTIDRAFILAARPEFGQFKDEINHVAKEIATGKELDAALLELGSRVRSEKLAKTVQLINSGVSAGGEISDLLQHIASNLRQQRLVDERIRSSVLVYVIFIFSAIGFGAPMLFSLSSFLIEVITDVFSKVEIPTEGVGTQIPISFSQVAVSTTFVNTYTIVSMIITSIMGSLILGLISKGNEKEGLKFLPILIILTITLFFTIKFLIAGLLSGLFQI